MGQENQINKEKAVNAYELENEEFVDECNSEMGKK